MINDDHDIECSYKTALHYATVQGEIEVVQVLLDANANVNAKDVCVGY